MASRMIGRAACPECGFASAHIKESEKCIYRYCPECGSQHHARTERQRADLMGKTRTVEGAATPSPTPTQEPTATPTPTGTVEPTATAAPEPTASTPAKAPAKRGSLFF